MAKYELKNKTILLTGGHGFLGRHVIVELEKFGPKKIVAHRSHEYDLRQRANIEKLFDIYQPDAVVHLAATVGGIKANRENPGRFFYDNAIMGIELIDVASKRGIEKMLTVGTICAYPKFTPTPFNEKDLWLGYPEETNAPYGLAKKMLLVQTQAYRQQYQFPGIFVLPTNLYGPHDNFDLESSHVIPAMIRKAVEAKQSKQDKVILWGSGKPTREFLFVEEAARGMVLALMNYDGIEPVNLGSGGEISIKALAEKIFALVGFTGEIVWDPSLPDGQPRRCVDTQRAKDYFGFVSSVDFDLGLKKTIDWYLQSQV